MAVGAAISRSASMRPLGAVLLHEPQQHREQHDHGDGDGLDSRAQRRRQGDRDEQDEDQDVPELLERSAQGEARPAAWSSFGPCSPSAVRPRRGSGRRGPSEGDRGKPRPTGRARRVTGLGMQTHDDPQSIRPAHALS